MSGARLLLRGLVLGALLGFSLALGSWFVWGVRGKARW